MTVITSYFYKNININTKKYDYLGEFTKFQSFFTEETNKDENEVLAISDNQGGSDQVYVVFSSGNQYTFVRANEAIYMNKVKIAKYVKNCVFMEEIQNGKSVLVATITIEDKTRTMKFVVG